MRAKEAQQEHPSSAATAGSDLVAQLERVRLESNTLYRIIGVIGLAPEVPRVLTGVVDLLTEATDSHACFIYLREGDILRLRAASGTFAHVVGQVQIPVGEGLVGWAVRHSQPALVAQNALDDPRFRYVPELHEERFQSMAAVPIPARSGEPIGAISLHTVAPHELHSETVTFLVHTASLVAGAIETAQLLEDAKLRVDALTTLSQISQQIAATEQRDDLYLIATDGVRALLACKACHLYEVDPASGDLELVASSPQGASAPARMRRVVDEPGWLSAAVASSGERLGLLRASQDAGVRTDADVELLGAIAGQVAVALKRAELIERLTEENIVRELFDALAAGRVDVAEARARAARFELGREHLVVQVAPARRSSDETSWIERAGLVESALRRLAPGTLVDTGAEALRAIVPAGQRGGDGLAIDEALRTIARSRGVAIGRSAAHRGAQSSTRAVHEAGDAILVAHALHPEGGAIPYEALGSYRYLVHLSTDAIPPDSSRAALERLSAYDERRQTQLVETLESYLEHRGSIRGAARALHVHPNTVRQRLDRIEKLAQIDLDAEDLLTLEVVVKLARLGKL